MVNIKNIIPTLLVYLSLIIVVGCGGSSGSSPSPIADDTTQAAPPKNQIFSLEVNLSDTVDFTFFSLLPPESPSTDVQFNAITHIQYLLVQDGLNYEESETKIREYFNVFTSSNLAYAKLDEHKDINTRILELATIERNTIDTTINTIIDELTSNNWGSYRDKIATDFSLAPLNPIVIEGNSSITLSIESPLLGLPQNNNYEMVWPDGPWNVIEKNSDILTITVEDNLFQPIEFIILDNNKRRVFYTSTELPTTLITQGNVSATEIFEQYKINENLTFSSQGNPEDITASTIPILESNNDNELLTIDISEIEGSPVFQYKYNPTLIENPQQIQISTEYNGEQTLISPRNVDIINHIVEFQIIRTQNVTREATKKSYVQAAPSKSSADNSKTLLHVEVIPNKPTGIEIAKLLDGKRVFLENAIATMFSKSNGLSVEEAINKIVAPLYSSDAKEKSLARAKLTAVLAVGSEKKGYPLYDEFASAINIAVASEVLTTISWDTDFTTNAAHYWFSACVTEYQIRDNLECTGKLERVYKYGPESLNAGIAAFVGANSLSKSQKTRLAIFRAIVSLGETKLSGDDLLDAQALAGMGLAIYNNDVINNVFLAGVSLSELVIQGRKVSTIAFQILLAKIGDFLGNYAETQVKRNNALRYTPLLFAMKSKKENLFNSVTVSPSNNLPGESTGWDRVDFIKDFLSHPPFNKLAKELKYPNEPLFDSIFDANSQFGSKLDPGRNFELRFLNEPLPLPYEGYTYSNIDNTSRYLGLVFMNAAFGDAQHSEDIKNLSNLSSALAIAPALLYAQKVRITDVTDIEMVILNRQIKFRAVIKSKYRDKDAFICEVFQIRTTKKYKYHYPSKCDSVTPNTTLSNIKNSQYGVPSYVSEQPKDSWISNYENNENITDLFDDLGISMSKEVFDDFKDRNIKFIDLEVEIHGLNITSQQSEGATLGDERTSTTLVNSSIKYDDFSYSDENEKYTLSLNTLFPEGNFEQFSDNLLGVGMRLTVSIDGVNHSVSSIKTITTLSDISKLIDIEQTNHQIGGEIIDVNGVVANQLVTLQPINRTYITDDEGRFSFSNVPDGNYTLVTKSRSTTLDVNLEPFPESGITIKIDILTPDQLNNFEVSSNDTGNSECPPQDNCQGHDANTRRDKEATNGNLDKIGSGRAGFDFTKVDENGKPLPESASEWSCVKDNVTNLVWEIKTTEGLRNISNKYSLTEDRGQCEGTESCLVEDYVNKLNEIKFCGFNDWRVPSIKNYYSIADHSLTSYLDPVFFPNHHNSTSSFITSSKHLLNDEMTIYNSAVFYKNSIGNYYLDGVDNIRDSYTRSLRLVRGD